MQTAEFGSDEEIINRVRQGKPAEFRHIVCRYTKLMQNYVRRILIAACSPLHLVEDVVQDTFLSLLRKIDRVHYKEGSISPLLYRIAHDFAISATRKWISQSNAEQGYHANAPKDAQPANPFNDQEKAQIVEIIRRLPETQRDVALLRYVEEKSISEIADILGISQQAVKDRLQRAKKALRPVLSQKRSPDQKPLSLQPTDLPGKDVVDMPSITSEIPLPNNSIVISASHSMASNGGQQM